MQDPKVGVYRRELEAGITQIHRGVKRGAIFQPLRAEPMLNSGHGIQHALFQCQQRAIERSCKVRNHNLAINKIAGNFSLVALEQAKKKGAGAPEGGGDNMETKQ